MTNKPKSKSKPVLPSCTKGFPAECKEYRLDLVDFATGNRASLSREKQKKLIQHLNECQSCQDAFLDYENIYAAGVAEEHTKTPEFQKKMSDVIVRLSEHSELQPTIVGSIPLKRNCRTMTRLKSESVPGLPAGQAGAKLDLNRHKFGESAGKIWNLLAEKGRVKVDDLPALSELPVSVAFGAMGWLVHENKVSFPKENGANYVTLAGNEREQKQAGV